MKRFAAICFFSAEKGIENILPRGKTHPNPVRFRYDYEVVRVKTAGLTTDSAVGQLEDQHRR